MILSNGSYRKIDSFASYFGFLYPYSDAVMGPGWFMILRSMPAVAQLLVVSPVSDMSKVMIHTKKNVLVLQVRVLA
jgi:hypothetical protein